MYVGGPDGIDPVGSWEMREEAHAVAIGDIPSLERFQVHLNGKSRFIVALLPLIH